MSEMLQKNLANLHAFWRAMTVISSENEIFSHPSWPNKIWHTDFIKINSNQWRDHIHVTLAEPLPLDKVTIKAQLTAMYLALENAKGVTHQQIVLVQSLKELQLWSSACGQAFGYEINTHSLVPLLNDENATIVAFQVNGIMAGTAILYQSNNNMGIHQVGVLPNFQGRGIGKALMLHLVALAKQKACKSITLQASQDGIAMYLNMGFTPLSSLYHLEKK